VGTTSCLLERAGVADALDPALAAHVIERENGMIRFTHPLLSSVLYADLGEVRRGVHARIAEIVEDPVLAARHTALSTDTPNADVARLLDDAATLANDRGASAVTAELAEQALRLTPPDRVDDRRRRALAAAHAHLAAGEWTHARTIATDLLAETEAGRSCRRPPLAEFSTTTSPSRSSRKRCMRRGRARRSRRGSRSASLRRDASGRIRRGSGRHSSALALADEIDDVSSASALGRLAWLGRMVGDSKTPEYAARACDLAAAAGDARLLREATVLLHGTFVDPDNINARRAILGAISRWRRRDISAHVLWSLSWCSFGASAGDSRPLRRPRSRHQAQYGVERTRTRASSWSPRTAVSSTRSG
jgi:hypothetical protein